MGDYFEIVWLTTGRAFVTGNMSGREVVRELDADEREQIWALNEKHEQATQKLCRSFVEQPLPTDPEP